MINTKLYELNSDSLQNIHFQEDEKDEKEKKRESDEEEEEQVEEIEDESSEEDDYNQVAFKFIYLFFSESLKIEFFLFKN